MMLACDVRLAHDVPEAVSLSTLSSSSVSYPAQPAEATASFVRGDFTHANAARTALLSSCDLMPIPGVHASVRRRAAFVAQVMALRGMVERLMLAVYCAVSVYDVCRCVDLSFLCFLPGVDSLLCIVQRFLCLYY